MKLGKKVVILEVRPNLIEQNEMPANVLLLRAGAAREFRQ